MRPILLILALCLVACTSDIDEIALQVEQKMARRAYWTDGIGKSHYDHRVEHLLTQYTDTTKTRVNRIYYRCFDSLCVDTLGRATQFIISGRPSEIAR